MRTTRTLSAALALAALAAVAQAAPPPTMTISNVTLAEGDSGTTNFVFDVTLSGTSSFTVTASYATQDGTAIAPGDYVAASSGISIPAGQLSTTITIAVNGETLSEGTESFQVVLSAVTHAKFPGGATSTSGTGTILDDDPLPSLSIADVGITEADSGTTNASFAVTLSAVSGQTATVNYATADGTALAGSDYNTTTGTLTFAPGATTQSITVPVIGDLGAEATQTFTVNLSGASAATIADGQGVGTITDNDPVPSLAIADVSTVEGDSGTSNASFVVSMAGTTEAAVTVDYTTTDGTAVAGTDYVGATGTLTFAPGAASRTILVAVNGDTQAELDEAFVVNLSNATNATLADNQGLGTIQNDDSAPTLSVGSASVTEGDSGTQTATFTVTLSQTSALTITVDFATADGTAVAGSDYASTSGSLTFAPGASTATLGVTVNGDTFSEVSETFSVNLSNASNAVITGPTGTGSINDNDPLASLSIDSVAVSEGNSGTVNAVFTVTLTPASGQLVTVNFASANVTAAAGTDYVANSGSLTFAPGVTTRTVTVGVTGDSVAETNETYTVTLSGAAGASIGSAQGVGTINDDDTPPNVFIGDVSLLEGDSGTSNAVFSVSLSAVSGQSITLNYASADGTALAGSDYVSGSGTLTFAPGTTTQTLAIAVNGDMTSEPVETFVVDLSNPANATISDSQGVGTITNDDAAPSLSINDVSVTEGNSGSSNSVFTVALSAASGLLVTVDFATSPGTATSGSDYGATTGTLSFAPGVTVQTLAVAVVGEATFEANETFFVDLGNPGNATILDGQGLGTIQNDDTLPLVSIGDASVVEGNTGAANAVFTLTLSSVSAQIVTVDYATADGSAASGSDYQAMAGTVTFPAGILTRTLAVPIIANSTVERNEAFLVDLSNPVNANLGRGQGQGVIYDDDGRADPETPIATAPITLTKRGRYHLERNLAPSILSGAAITIAADGVVLDLRGFTLDGGSDYSTPVYGIYSDNHRLLTVLNGSVRGFLTGVYLSDPGPYTVAQYRTVRNLKAVDNTYAGIWVEGRGSLIQGNSVTGTTGTSVNGPDSDVYGIAVVGGRSKVLRNSVGDTSGVGAGAGLAIAVMDGPGSSVAYNKVQNTSLVESTGVLVDNSTSVKVTANRLTALNYGVVYQNGATGVYKGNVLTGVVTGYVGGTPFP